MTLNVLILINLENFFYLYVNSKLIFLIINFNQKDLFIIKSIFNFHPSNFIILPSETEELDNQ